MSTWLAFLIPFLPLFTGIRYLAHVLAVPPTKARLLCATPAGLDLYIQAMSVGTYRVQSPGFPKIIYWFDVAFPWLFWCCTWLFQCCIFLIVLYLFDCFGSVFSWLFCCCIFLLPSGSHVQKIKADIKHNSLALLFLLLNKKCIYNAHLSQLKLSSSWWNLVQAPLVQFG